MKKTFIRTLIGLTALTLLSGCLGLHLGGGTTNKTQTQAPTVGQQLVDLKKAKDAGAITEAEYQTQRSRVLGQ